MINKYNEKKMKNQDLAKKIHKHVGDKTAKRIEECNNFMAFIADRDIAKRKQIYGNSCKNRFCPICSFRLSNKDAFKIATLMEYLSCEYGMTYIMATFTAPNVRGEELKSEIDRFNKAFKDMVLRDDIKNMNKGYIRKLEVTYNKDETITPDMWHGLNGRKPMKEYFKRKGLKIGDANPNYDTYHTHFHVMFAVNKSYFTESAIYLSQAKWLNLWREAMNDNTITQVDIRKVKKGASGKGNGTREIAKYSAKDSDYLLNQEVFDTMYTSLKGRQLITFNKLFAEANKKYKNKELEHYKSIDTTEYVYMLSYLWGERIYNETERRELTAEEKKQFNGWVKSEIEDG